MFQKTGKVPLPAITYYLYSKLVPTLRKAKSFCSLHPKSFLERGHYAVQSHRQLHSYPGHVHCTIQSLNTNQSSFHFNLNKIWKIFCQHWRSCPIYILACTCVFLFVCLLGSRGHPSSVLRYEFLLYILVVFSIKKIHFKTIYFFCRKTLILAVF